MSVVGADHASALIWKVFVFLVDSKTAFNVEVGPAGCFCNYKFSILIYRLLIYGFSEWFPLDKAHNRSCRAPDKRNKVSDKQGTLIINVKLF